MTSWFLIIITALCTCMVIYVVIPEQGVCTLVNIIDNSYCTNTNSTCNNKYFLVPDNNKYILIEYNSHCIDDNKTYDIKYVYNFKNNDYDKNITRTTSLKDELLGVYAKGYYMLSDIGTNYKCYYDSGSIGIDLISSSVTKTLLWSVMIACLLVVVSNMFQ